MNLEYTMARIAPALSLFLMMACSSAARFQSVKTEKNLAKSSHYHDGVFHNVEETPLYTKNKMAIYWDFFFSGADDREPETAPVWQKVTKAELLQNQASGNLHITWFGHASFLVQTDKKNILIDPMFSDRSSPFSWVGPKRFHPAPISVADLPPIDVIVISHDHFDHLDQASMKILSKVAGKFLVPLGVAKHLADWGVDPSKISELDWHESKEVAGLSFTCTPARHFSGRSIVGMNKTLWASWVIKSDQSSIFYSGDTGPMKNAFREIGNKYGPFDVTIMQLGMYGKDWPYVHMTPEEAIDAHKQLKGKIMFPAHWGTFALAQHGWKEPIDRTKAAARRNGIKVIYTMPGEQIAFKNGQPVRSGKLATIISNPR